MGAIILYVNISETNLLLVLVDLKDAWVKLPNYRLAVGLLVTSARPCLLLPLGLLVTSAGLYPLLPVLNSASIGELAW